MKAKVKECTGQKEHPIQVALAYAFAADRINKGYVKETRRFSEDVPTIFANKEIVKFSFSQIAQDGSFVPADFIEVVPTNDDYENVDLAVKHFRRYSLEILGPNLSDFQKDVFNTVIRKTVSFNKLGLVAYVPELVRREIKEAKLKKLLRTEYRNSDPVGSPGDHINGNLKIIDKHWSSNWESYNYVGDYMGNLVSFMNKIPFNIDQRINFKAKVKAHGKNRFFDVTETRINYLRKLKS